jgi:5-methylcytosine-specific restriction endonuclease McrA
VAERRIKADDDWLPGESKEERIRRRSRERAAVWRQNNPEHVKQLSLQSQAKRADNWEEFLASERRRYPLNAKAKLERQRAAIEADPQHRKAVVRRSYEKHKAKFIARVAARRAARLQATPKWIEIEDFKAIYAAAREISVRTGVPHEVDHIWPLRGKLAWGLHVPWNLQILTRAANRRKFNKATDA